MLAAIPQLCRGTFSHASVIALACAAALQARAPGAGSRPVAVAIICGYLPTSLPTRSLQGRPRRDLAPVTSSADPGPLLEALKAVLRPLLRLMVARGVTLPALVAALKELYVDVAGRDFRLDGKPPSDSRVSLLTGVHRKDVRAIRESARPLSTPRGPNLGATVVGRWLGDPALADAEGRPRPLPRLAAAGPPSFEALVEAVSKDVRPRTVLDELVRLGLAAWDTERDEVRLLADAFVPAGPGEEVLGFFRDNLRDHLAAAVGNLLAAPGERRFLERAVYYNNLRPADVDRLEAEARTLALAALRHLNSLALEHQAAARGDPAARERFRFGAFLFREAPPETDAGPGEDRA
jgi:hypothetical protein